MYLFCFWGFFARSYARKFNYCLIKNCLLELLHGGRNLSNWKCGSYGVSVMPSKSSVSDRSFEMPLCHLDVPSAWLWFEPSSSLLCWCRRCGSFSKSPRWTSEVEGRGKLTAWICGSLWFTARSLVWLPVDFHSRCSTVTSRFVCGHVYTCEWLDLHFEFLNVNTSKCSGTFRVTLFLRLSAHECNRRGKIIFEYLQTKIYIKEERNSIYFVAVFNYFSEHFSIQNFIATHQLSVKTHL